ncbi:MAG TPA: oxygenase MpaB family protein [Candidatus Limnocylindria bacterium]|nr:oxygenase MpaB family protein [Candidatus Limnocylindria bacterium]
MAHRPHAEILGIPLDQQPATLACLERYERAMLATSVCPDETSRRVARHVLRPFGWVPAPAYWPTEAIAAALVPRPLRAPSRLRYRVRERVFFAIVIATARIMRAVLPMPLTVVPQARRFEARRAR